MQRTRCAGLVDRASGMLEEASIDEPIDEQFRMVSECGVRDEIESGRIILDPFDDGSLCEERQALGAMAMRSMFGAKVANSEKQRRPS